MPLPNRRDAQTVVGLYTRPVFTFATLPSAAENVGRVLLINDMSTNPATTTGQVAVGAGTTQGRVLSDGTAWRIYGWTGS